jgi:hypothetical protein
MNSVELSMRDLLELWQSLELLQKIPKLCLGDLQLPLLMELVFLPQK